MDCAIALPAPPAGGYQNLCRDVSSNFADSARGCEQGYFEFSHNYECGVSELALSGVGKAVSTIANQDVRTRLLRMGLSSTDKVCVFKPKAQVTDNWGWCNGSMGDAAHTPKDEGYYDDTSVDGTLNCSEDDLLSDPWTYYKGEIIVVPSR
ncbi:MAG: hypothetical protein WC862_05630 [Patescibacteria group bacterium]